MTTVLRDSELACAAGIGALAHLLASRDGSQKLHGAADAAANDRSSAAPAATGQKPSSTLDPVAAALLQRRAGTEAAALGKLIDRILRPGTTVKALAVKELSSTSAVQQQASASTGVGSGTLSVNSLDAGAANGEISGPLLRHIDHSRLASLLHLSLQLLADSAYLPAEAVAHLRRLCVAIADHSMAASSHSRGVNKTPAHSKLHDSVLAAFMHHHVSAAAPAGPATGACGGGTARSTVASAAVIVNLWSCTIRTPHPFIASLVEHHIAGGSRSRASLGATEPDGLPPAARASGSAGARPPADSPALAALSLRAITTYAGVCAPAGSRIRTATGVAVKDTVHNVHSYVRRVSALRGADVGASSSEHARLHWICGGMGRMLTPSASSSASAGAAGDAASVPTETFALSSGWAVEFAAQFLSGDDLKAVVAYIQSMVIGQAATPAPSNPSRGTDTSNTASLPQNPMWRPPFDATTALSIVEDLVALGVDGTHPVFDHIAMLVLAGDGSGTGARNGDGNGNDDGRRASEQGGAPTGSALAAAAAEQRQRSFRLLTQLYAHINGINGDDSGSSISPESGAGPSRSIASSSTSLLAPSPATAPSSVAVPAAALIKDAVSSSAKASAAATLALESLPAASPTAPPPSVPSSPDAAVQPRSPSPPVPSSSSGATPSSIAPAAPAASEAVVPAASTSSAVAITAVSAPPPSPAAAATGSPASLLSAMISSSPSSLSTSVDIVIAQAAVLWRLQPSLITTALHRIESAWVGWVLNVDGVRRYEMRMRTHSHAGDGFDDGDGGSGAGTHGSRNDGHENNSSASSASSIPASLQPHEYRSILNQRVFRWSSPALIRALQEMALEGSGVGASASPAGSRAAAADVAIPAETANMSGPSSIPTAVQAAGSTNAIAPSSTSTSPLWTLPSPDLLELLYSLISVVKLSGDVRHGIRISDPTSAGAQHGQSAASRSSPTSRGGVSASTASGVFSRDRDPSLRPATVQIYWRAVLSVAAIAYERGLVSHLVQAQHGGGVRVASNFVVDWCIAVARAGRLDGHLHHHHHHHPGQTRGWQGPGSGSASASNDGGAAASGADSSHANTSSSANNSSGSASVPAVCPSCLSHPFYSSVLQSLTLGSHSAPAAMRKASIEDIDAQLRAVCVASSPADAAILLQQSRFFKSAVAGRIEQQYRQQRQQMAEATAPPVVTGARSSTIGDAESIVQAGVTPSATAETSGTASQSAPSDATAGSSICSTIRSDASSPSVVSKSAADDGAADFALQRGWLLRRLMANQKRQRASASAVHSTSVGDRAAIDVESLSHVRDAVAGRIETIVKAAARGFDAAAAAAVEVSGDDHGASAASSRHQPQQNQHQQAAGGLIPAVYLQRILVHLWAVGQPSNHTLWLVLEGVLRDQKYSSQPPWPQPGAGDEHGHPNASSAAFTPTSSSVPQWTGHALLCPRGVNTVQLASFSGRNGRHNGGAAHPATPGKDSATEPDVGSDAANVIGDTLHLHSQRQREAKLSVGNIRSIVDAVRNEREVNARVVKARVRAAAKQRSTGPGAAPTVAAAGPAAAE